MATKKTKRLSEDDRIARGAALQRARMMAEGEYGATPAPKAKAKAKAPGVYAQLDALAAKITAHLKRIEADPKLNPYDKPEGCTPYYHPFATRRGIRVGLQYISYQGQTPVEREVAERYLAWLDAGKVGRHFEMLHEEERAPTGKPKRARDRVAAVLKTTK